GPGGGALARRLADGPDDLDGPGLPPAAPGRDVPRPGCRQRLLPGPPSAGVVKLLLEPRGGAFRPVLSPLGRHLPGGPGRHSLGQRRIARSPANRLDIDRVATLATSESRHARVVARHPDSGGVSPAHLRRLRGFTV